MSDTQHPLVTLCEEAKPGDWVVQVRFDHPKGWRIKLDGETMGLNADLSVAAQEAIDNFRTWES